MRVLPIVGLSLFCEDVREEVGGTVSIVGIMPDNILVNAVPAALPKLSVYTRISFDPAVTPNEIEMFLRLPNGVDEGHNKIDPALIKKASQDTLAGKGTMAGLVSRVSAFNFQIHSPGRVFSIMRVDGIEYAAGSITFGVTSFG